MPSSSDIPVIQRSEPAQDFDSLFAAHYIPLTRVVYRIVGDAGWAEEVAAEAFWKLYDKRPASDHNLAGWLYRIALRLALDHLKKRRRRAHYEAQAPPPGAMQSPQESLEQNERRDRVRRVLAAMKPDQAALLVLRSEGYSQAEIANMLGMNPGSVGTFLARADVAFRKEYVNRYGQH